MTLSITFIGVYGEVNHLFDIEDSEKLTEKETANLFIYFNNTDKLSDMKKALIKSKNDKFKLAYLRNLLTFNMSFKIKNVFEFLFSHYLTFSIIPNTYLLNLMLFLIIKPA